MISRVLASFLGLDASARRRRLARVSCNARHTHNLPTKLVSDVLREWNPPLQFAFET